MLKACGVNTTDYRVFEMFQTLEPRDKREGKYLGLTLLGKVIEANGRVIEIFGE